MICQRIIPNGMNWLRLGSLPSVSILTILAMSSEPETLPNDPIKSPKVLLIDLENCPHQLATLLADLDSYVQVIICHAQSTAKIPLNWLESLAAAIAAHKLRIIKMQASGKNSADFGICFFAGALMQELPPETHFVIVSNDADLDHAVHLLKGQGRSAERIGALKPPQDQKPDQQPVEIPQHSPQNSQSLNDYCADLIKHAKNRPSKVETLMGNLTNRFYKERSSLPQEVYTLLLATGVIQITGTKIVYNEAKIREFASKV